MGHSQLPASKPEFPDQRSRVTTKRKYSLHAMLRISPRRVAYKCFMALSRYSSSHGHGRLRKKNPEPEAKGECPLRKFIAQLQSDDVEKREILNVPKPTLSEVLQVICDSWELGLKDDMVFLVLMSRIKRLLDGCVVGGEAGERRHVTGEQCRFGGHWQEDDAEMNPRVRVDPGEMEQDNSSTTWSEGSDARSMAYSAYTVRSVTSFKEQTSQLVWP